MKFLLIFLSIFFLSHAEARILKPESMSYWYKLLHYRPTLFGKMRSEVDSKDFFTSENGKESPEEELKTFIHLINSPRAQKFVCKFPLRYKWLKGELENNWNYTTESCAIYKSFVDKLAAKNLSLVFSSFYINNPGSTFGHTFIRVSRYKDFRQNELLDYAINFAAESSKDNVLIYMLKGLGGFYPGKFSVVPYYYKIREYNDHEFRDIWDYDLGLNQDQIDRVVDHVWELGPAYFDYFYFTENCSYHILGLLNVAYEGIDILEGLGPFYVLPIDTVKEMKKLSLIKARKVRVSAYGKLIKETEGFSTEKLKLVKNIGNNTFLAKDSLKEYSVKESADLLDASISALDYLKAERVLLNEKDTTEQRRELLNLRAENPHISEDLNYDFTKMHAPEEAHDSSRLGFFAGDRYNQGAFSGLEWRAAQHELLDSNKGHLKNSQVVMFDIKFRYQTINFNTKKMILDRFRIFDLKKYRPSDFWNSSVSFDLALGLDQRRECAGQDCLAPITTFGFGSSVALTSDHILSLLMGGSYRFDKVYKNDSFLNLGPKLNFLVLKDEFSMGFDAAYFLPTEQFDSWLKRRLSFELDLRYFLQRNTSLFFKTTHLEQEVGNQQEAQLGIYFYH